MTDLIRAELTGDESCRANSVTARGGSPVIALCRKLVAAGYDPTTRLETYRGDALCLSVRSIGEAARLEINGRGNGFRYQSSVGTGRPIAPNDLATTPLAEAA
jgi:hypothetical protein